MNRQLLDSQGPIPKMTPTQALTAIQTMADHSQKWHDGTSNRNISSSSDTDGLATVISKLDNFRRDMKKLKENIHAIQVGCQICEGPHLDKECPLNEEVKQVDEVKYGEFRRPAPFNGSNKAKFRVENDPGSFILPCSIERLDVNNALADLGASSIMPFLMFKRLGIGKLEPIDMVIEMADDTKCIPKGIVKNMLIKIDKFILPIDFVILDMIEDFRMPAILGRHLLATAHEKVDIFRKTISLEVGNEKVIFKTRSNFSDNIHESVRMIKTKMNTEEDELMKRDYDVFTYNTNACEINHLLSVDPDMFTYDIEVQESYEEIVYKCSLIAQEADRGLRSNLTSIKKKLHWCTPISRTKEGVQEIWASCSPFEEKCDGGLESEDFKDPDGCGESKENKILGTIINKLHDEWFKGTHEDDDDLEGISDYLEPTLYDGFIDSDDEEYKERKCRLLGMPYIKPPPILIEKVKVTRYSVGPGEVYTKIKVLETEELSRTRGNIANIRARIMEEILRNDDEEESYDET
ncbi:zinc knuckle CX2CX4HX4C containing protein [Tanacetum coccineum]